MDKREQPESIPGVTERARVAFATTGKPRSLPDLANGAGRERLRGYMADALRSPRREGGGG